MRPLFLSVKGFGPFVDLKIEEKVFEKLAENKIFLISGEIGAGKTTIFDAILYALYGETSVGETSRDKRNPQDLISHLIKDKKNLVPEVEFKFFLDGKIYRIKRRPSFEGRSKKVGLWIQDKFFSDREHEVNNKIKELFKLDAKQFKKVFLIPQGEYRNILLSKPEEREELFKTIFDTYIFSEIEDFFKEKAKDLKQQLIYLLEKEKNLQKILETSNLKEIEKKKNLDEQQLKQLQLKIDFLTSKKHQIELEIKTKEEILETLTKLEEIQAKLLFLEKKHLSIKEKEKKLKLLTTLKEQFGIYELFVHLKKELLLIQEKLKFLNEQKRELEQKIRFLNAELEKINKSEPQIQLVKLKLETLKEVQKYLKERETLLVEINALKNQLSQNSKKQDLIKQEKEKIKTQIEVLSEKLNLFNKAQFLLIKQKELKEIYEKLQKIENLLKEKDELIKITKELEEKVEKLEALKKELELKNIALTLSELLKEGEPCPVCGATDHPSPIKDENFKLKLEILKKDLQTHTTLLERYKNQLLITENTINNLKLDTDSFNLKEISLKLKLLEEELDKILAKTDPKILNPEYGEILEKDIKSLKHRQLQVEEKEKEMANLLEHIKIELSQKLGKLENLETFLKKLLDKEINVSEVDQYIKENETLISTWEKQKKSIEENLSKYSEEYLRVEQDLKNTENFKKDRILEYKKCLFKLLPLLKNKIINTFKFFEYVKDEFSEIERLRSEIEDFYVQKNLAQKSLEDIFKKLEKFEKSQKPDLIKEELKKLREKKSLIEQELQVINQEIGKIKERLFHLERLIKEYRELLEEKRKVEKEYELVAKISELLSGKNPKGVSFHLFVLSIFARVVFQTANFYLSHFSFGRYRFIEDFYLQKKGGIEVFDGYTGTKREVKTLSGGESFLATLALALGISDVLIYLFKTKPFESLFIDEGFGSLDEKTLEKVVEVLLNLSTKSGRIIGIISHLSELKEVFPVILEVLKDPVYGSKVRLINKNLTYG